LKISQGFFVRPDYTPIFDKLGLTDIDAVFEFNVGENLNKSNLAKYRTRLKFNSDDGKDTFFLKRYNCPPLPIQLKNWLSHHSRACTSDFDRLAAEELAEAGINTPLTVAHGCQCGRLFEKRSFIITRKIPNAESLEKKLPECFYGKCSKENLNHRRNFVNALADFTALFHKTGFRHRDFYLAHIFLSTDSQFYLIDLQRAFKPLLFGERFRVKDIAQLYYSAPAGCFTRTDRLRFYLRYTGKKTLGRADKRFIRTVIARAGRMAGHDLKHNRQVGFVE